MPLARQSEFPVAVARAKPLTFARKPALAKYQPASLAQDQRIAVALVAAMDAHGMTNCHLAALLGLSESVIRRWKTREKPIGARHLLVLEMVAPAFHADLRLLAQKALGGQAVNDNDVT